jgi:hypothetical protein
VIKELGVDSVEDYVERRAGIWKYLTEEWFRLADGEVDRTHTTREVVSAIWERVRAAGREVFGGAAVTVSRVVRRCYDAKANGAQAVGNGIAGLVAAGAYVADVEDLVDKLMLFFEDAIRRKPAAWLEKFTRKDARARHRVPRIVEFQ